MSQFVKVGNAIVPKPKGFDYDLILGKIYDLSDYYAPRLKENGDFNLPEKIYESEKDKRFKNIVLNHFKNTSQQTTGVLLAGEKGTGKSIQAKLIAKASGLPIINVSQEIQRNAMIEFFKNFDEPVCLIFDEFDKYFNSEDLLCLLDGIEKTTKMLIIFTCNNTDKLSEYLKDRCSRIRYIRKFTSKDNASFIPELIDELGLENKEDLITFCENSIKYPTVDNVKAFLTEYKSLKEEKNDITPTEAVEFLNITLV